MVCVAIECKSDAHNFFWYCPSPGGSKKQTGGTILATFLPVLRKVAHLYAEPWRALRMMTNLETREIVFFLEKMAALEGGLHCITSPVGMPASRSSSSHRTAYSVFTILGVLLFAGQAVTIYFVYQHQNQISKLTTTAQDLQMESLARNLPHKPKSSGQMKRPMVNMMPLAMRDVSGTESPEDETQLSNKTEDMVKRLLLMGNPTRKFPKLEKAFMDNMIQLKKTMDYSDWNSFEIWMHKWLLFQMAQTEHPEETAAAKVQTKCQAEASIKGIYPGKFRPQCDENGDYLPKQCNHSTGYCWCAYKNGTEIEGTQKRGPLDCTGMLQILDPENVTYSGQDLPQLN